MISGATAAMQEFLGNFTSQSPSKGTTSNIKEDECLKQSENTDDVSLPSPVMPTDIVSKAATSPTTDTSKKGNTSSAPINSKPTAKEETTSESLSIRSEVDVVKKRMPLIHHHIVTLPSTILRHHFNDVHHIVEQPASPYEEPLTAKCTITSARQPHPIILDIGIFYSTHTFEGVAMTVPFSVTVTLATRYYYQYVYSDVAGVDEVKRGIRSKQEDGEEVTMEIFKYLAQEFTNAETHNDEDDSDKKNDNNSVNTKYECDETDTTHTDIAHTIPLMSKNHHSDLKTEIYDSCINSVFKCQGEGIFSPFYAGSELSSINRGDGNCIRSRSCNCGIVTDEYTISEDMYRVLCISEELNRVTEGLFDPTVMSLDRRSSRITGDDIDDLEGFSRDTELSERSMIREKMKDTCGWSRRIQIQAPLISDCSGGSFVGNTPPKLIITHSAHYKGDVKQHGSGGTISNSPSFKTFIDLCAISKGYIADAIHKKLLDFTHKITIEHQLPSVHVGVFPKSAAVMLTTDIHSHFVNWGGDIVVHGKQPVRVLDLSRNITTSPSPLVRMIYVHKDSHYRSPSPDHSLGMEGEKHRQHDTTINLSSSGTFYGDRIDFNHNKIVLEQTTIRWRPWKVTVLWPIGKSHILHNSVTTNTSALLPHHTGITLEFSDGNEHMVLEESTVGQGAPYNISNNDAEVFGNAGCLCICTSGNIPEGHIINPCTGIPLPQYRPGKDVFMSSEGDVMDKVGTSSETTSHISPIIVSVTVVSESSCAEADGLATAVMLFGTVEKAKTMFYSWQNTLRSTIFTHTLTSSNSVTSLTKERHKSFFFTGLKRVIVVDSDGLLSILYDVRPESRGIHIEGAPTPRKNSIIPVDLHKKLVDKAETSIKGHFLFRGASSSRYALMYNNNNNIKQNDIIRLVHTDPNPNDFIVSPSADRFTKGSAFLQGMSRLFARRTICFLFVKCDSIMDSLPQDTLLQSEVCDEGGGGELKSLPSVGHHTSSSCYTNKADNSSTRYLGIAVSSIASMDPTTAAVFLEKHSLVAHIFEQLYNKNQLIAMSCCSNGSSAPDIFLIFPQARDPSHVSAPQMAMHNDTGHTAFDSLLDMFTTCAVITVNDGARGDCDSHWKPSPRNRDDVSSNKMDDTRGGHLSIPQPGHSNNQLLEAIVEECMIRGCYGSEIGKKGLNEILHRDVTVIPCSIIPVVSPPPFHGEVNTNSITMFSSTLVGKKEILKDTNSELLSSKEPPTVFGLGDHYIGMVTWAAFRHSSSICTREPHTYDESHTSWGHIPYVFSHSIGGVTASGEVPPSGLIHTNCNSISTHKNEIRPLKISAVGQLNLRSVTDPKLSTALSGDFTPRLTSEQLKSLKGVNNYPDSCDEGTFLFYIVQRIGVKYISSLLKQQLSLCDVMSQLQSGERPNSSLLCKSSTPSQCIKQLHFSFDSGISAVGLFASVFDAESLSDIPSGRADVGASLGCKRSLLDSELPLCGTAHRHALYHDTANCSKVIGPTILGATLHSVDINGKGETPYITAMCIAGPLTQKILFGREYRQSRVNLEAQRNKDTATVNLACSTSGSALRPMSPYDCKSSAVHAKSYLYINSPKDRREDDTQAHHDVANSPKDSSYFTSPNTSTLTSLPYESPSLSSFSVSYADNNQWHKIYGGVTVRLCFFAEAGQYNILGGDDKKRSNKRNTGGEDGKGQLKLFSDISSAALTTEDNFRFTSIPNANMMEEFTVAHSAGNEENNTSTGETPMIQFLDRTFCLEHTVAAVDCIVESVMEVTTETIVTKRLPAHQIRSQLSNRGSSVTSTSSRIGTPHVSYLLKLIPIRIIKEFPSPYGKDGSTTILL